MDTKSSHLAQKSTSILVHFAWLAGISILYLAIFFIPLPLPDGDFASIMRKLKHPVLIAVATDIPMGARDMGCGARRNDVFHVSGYVCKKD